MKSVQSALSLIGFLIIFLLPNLVWAEIKEFRVAGWNMESGESDDSLLKTQIGEKQDIDIWGFSEVRNVDAAQIFEEGAEIGEGANFDTILGSTGRADRLAIVYNTERLELLGFEELRDRLFERHRAPLVARFRGKVTGLEFKFMVNHLARRDGAAREAQADFLNRWIETEALPVIAVGDYNFDYHVKFGDSGERDEAFDAMIADDRWIWLRPERLVKTQASDNYMTVLDFVFVANPPAGITGSSTILNRSTDSPASALDFDDSNSKTDHRPVDAVFVIGTETEPVEDLDSTDELMLTVDKSDILKRIETLQSQLDALKAALIAR